MLLVNLYSKKIEIDNYIHQNQYEDDIEEIFAEDLELLDFQMETILDYKDDVEEVTIETTSSQNEIIFLKNSSLEPVIFQDMKGKEEYYDSFLELLKSIQNGNLKNVKHFVNLDNVKDIYEVRGSKTRILFSKLKDNVFVVMSAFVKKCDTDLRHRNFVINVSQKYQLQKEYLLKTYNEKGSSLDNQYLNNLYEMLSTKRR